MSKQTKQQRSAPAERNESNELQIEVNGDEYVERGFAMSHVKALVAFAQAFNIRFVIVGTGKDDGSVNLLITEPHHLPPIVIKQRTIRRVAESVTGGRS